MSQMVLIQNQQKHEPSHAKLVSSKSSEGIKNSSDKELQFELTALTQLENESEKELDKD